MATRRLRPQRPHSHTHPHPRAPPAPLKMMLLLPPPPLLLLLLALASLAPLAGGRVAGAAAGGGGARCLPDRLALYRLRLETHWTRDLFPKQYPEFRPPAQWSRLVGRSHDARFVLFRVGAEAGAALAAFAESGRADALEAQGPPGAVLDEFAAAPLSTGAGRAEAAFFADGNHTKVSAVVRIVPSPDWFIGIDSIELCEDGFWAESLTIRARPLDAGSDNGFTFTAPNWPSEPRQPITRIAAHAPSHPASSFFYPQLRRLPPIATFRIKLEKTFHISEEGGFGQPGGREMNNDVLPADDDTLHSPRRPRPRTRPHPHKRRNKAHRAGKAGAGAGAGSACAAGPWSAWSACSATCGVGEAWRERRVVRAATGGGAGCGPLREARPCAGDAACPQRFFAW